MRSVLVRLKYNSSGRQWWRVCVWCEKRSVTVSRVGVRGPRRALPLAGLGLGSQACALRLRVGVRVRDAMPMGLA